MESMCILVDNMWITRVFKCQNVREETCMLHVESTCIFEVYTCIHVESTWIFGVYKMVEIRWTINVVSTCIFGVN